ncbi:MAG: hypothetical protein IT287_08315 [Bdellovibrionaceae bacterium]|nr:hypothetical protein [Pseudobdellovibrionaceae bacterium]
MGSVIQKLLAIVAVLCLMLLGLFFNQIGFKTVSVIGVVFTLIAILYVKTEISLFLIITFIWFQGFFKIISNYNPIVHVGADLVVIALLLKLLFVKPPKHKKPPPLVGLFALHFCWVIVTCFNPYSLSVVSNIAGAKVYVSMFLLYFFGYYLTQSLRDVKKLFTLFSILAVIQMIFTIYQGMIGPTSVTTLHPGYQVQLNKFIGYAFRPFGLTHIPGGPSVYIYTALPFIVYSIYASRRWIVQFFYVSVLPLMGLSLVMCQVRSAIAKAVFSLIIFVGTMLTSKLPISFAKKAYTLAGSAVLTGLTLFAMTYLFDLSVKSYEDNEMSIDRSFSTFDMNAISVARRGAMDRFITYLRVVPFGAGFSRVGASAGAFEDVHKTDTFFAKGYFFSDNLFVHLLVELGLPGVFILTLLIGSVLFIGIKIWRTESRAQLIGPQMAILSSLVAIAAGSYGAEGIIYNPESCFFWLFAGVMMSMRNPDFGLDG